MGPGSWVGEPIPADFTSVPDIPGYLGLVPFENPAPENYRYLQRLRQYEYARNMSLSDSVPKYGASTVQPSTTSTWSNSRSSRSGLTCATPSGAETVDAVVAMAKALGSLPHSQRRNGTAVRAAILRTDFAGVSGHVKFDPNGDLMHPKFSVLNLGPRSPVTGEFSWSSVGTVGAQAGQSNVSTSKICWPVYGCGVTPPSDRHPAPPPSSLADSDSVVETIVVETIVVIAALVLAVIVTLACLDMRKHKQKQRTRFENWQQQNITLPKLHASNEGRYRIVANKDGIRQSGSHMISRVQARDVTTASRHSFEQDDHQVRQLYFLCVGFSCGRVFISPAKCSLRLVAPQEEDEKMITFMSSAHFKTMTKAFDRLGGDDRSGITRVLAVSKEDEPINSDAAKNAAAALKEPEARHALLQNLGKILQTSLLENIKQSQDVDAKEADSENPKGRLQPLYAVVTQPQRTSLDSDFMWDMAGVEKFVMQKYLRQIAELSWELEQEKVVHLGSRLRHFDVDRETDSITLHGLHKLMLIEAGPVWQRYSTSMMPPETARLHLERERQPTQKTSGPIFEDSEDDKRRARSIQHAMWGFGLCVFRLSNTRGAAHLFPTSAKGDFSDPDLEVTSYVTIAQVTSIEPKLFA